MTKRKKFLLCILFVTLDVFLLVGFVIIKDATSYNILRNEVSSLVELDVTKDRYNIKTKSSGGYAIVEEAIKSYLDGYAVEIQDLALMVNDPSLVTVLSYDNYVKDGPLFKKSLPYLKNNKDSFNKKIDFLIQRLDSQFIKNYISDKTSSRYYISLYHGYMFDSEMGKELQEVRDLLVETKNRINNIYDTSIDVLCFLKEYKDYWKTEDGEIKFQTEDLYNYYMKLVSNIKKSDLNN